MNDERDGIQGALQVHLRLVRGGALPEARARALRGRHDEVHEASRRGVGEEGMRLWTSDEHFGHVRISELAGRPFPWGSEGVPAMNQELIRRYRAVTGDDGEGVVTFHCGDFAMGKIHDTIRIVEDLPGAHYLVAGNHDRCFPGFTRGHGRVQTPEEREGWASAYKASGFTLIWNYHAPLPSIVMHADDTGTPVLVSHFPYLGGGDSHEDEERFREFRAEDDGSWLICGHVHQAWRQRGKMINVGVDAWGGYPVTEGEIAALIEAGPRDLEPLSWDREVPA